MVASVSGGLLHDPLDRAGATPALRIAAEATIELARGARRPLCDHCGSHLVIAQNVAGADDHRIGSDRQSTGVSKGPTERSVLRGGAWNGPPLKLQFDEDIGVGTEFRGDAAC
jgi:hypothetical protein